MRLAKLLNPFVQKTNKHRRDKEMGGKVSALGKDTADDDVSAVKKSMLQNINFTFAKVMYVDQIIIVTIQFKF